MRSVKSILFNDMDLQKIEFDLFNERVLCEACFGMPFKIVNVAVQPERFFEIELHTDIVQRAKYLVCPGVGAVAADDGIVKHTVIFENFSP